MIIQANFKHRKATNKEKLNLRKNLDIYNTILKYLQQHATNNNLNLQFFFKKGFDSLWTLSQRLVLLVAKDQEIRNHWCDNVVRKNHVKQPETQLREVLSKEHNVGWCRGWAAVFELTLWLRIKFALQ